MSDDFVALLEQARRELSRLYDSTLERAIKRCIDAGFHVSCIEREGGYPVGTAGHPVRVRGAYDRELARVWVSWPEPGDSQPKASIGWWLAPDVEEAGGSVWP